MTEEILKEVLKKHSEWLKTRFYDDVKGERADLRCADLRCADLRNADLRNAIGIPLACPEKGEFTGFKKAHNERGKVIVELSIPEDSKRSSATGRKCRCDKAKVIDITSLDGNTHYKSAISFHALDFIYVVGKTVTVENFEDDRWNECAPGIHFFITRQEAVEY